MVKNGHDYKGSQKYRCNACESYGTLVKQDRDPVRHQEQVKKAMLERLSLRAIERLYGVPRGLVNRCGIGVGSGATAT